MLPIHLLAWETDVTLRAAIEASAQSTLAPIAAPSLLAGGELAFDAKAVGRRSSYGVEVRGALLRGLSLTSPIVPEDSLSADGSANASWVLGPLATLSLTTQTSLATTFGIRADSLLLARDPFTNADRLEYGFGADVAYDVSLSPRAELSLQGGYSQEGALASNVPEALGADSREARLGLSIGLDVAPRLSMGPEVEVGVTRYEHALLDVERHRGRADIHHGSLALGASYALTPDLSLRGSAGATIASPMPIIESEGPVAAPEISMGLRYRGRRAEITARYTSSYSTLGPRLGSGYRQSATVRFTTWPLAANQIRSLVVKGLLRASHGVAPLGADPPLPMPGVRALPANAALMTTSVGGRVTMDVPLRPGWALTAGVDLTFARGAMIPGRDSREVLTGMLTVGLAATASTDPKRLYPRDPGADADDARRRDGAHTGLGVRTEDRTRTSGSREEEER